MKKLYAIIGLIVLYLLDRYSKILAVQKLKGSKSIDIISGVFRLSYVENKGAAWGMMEGQTLIFAIITVIVIGAVIWLYIGIGDGKRYLPIKAFLVVFSAGVLGNFYDRMVYRKVVDMLDFYFIDYPVFNLADVFIVVSSIAIVSLMLFYYEDDEIKFKKFSSLKNRGKDAK